MHVYTDKQKEKIGRELSAILGMRKSRVNKDWFYTAWGDKTAKGVFEVVRRLGQDIEQGNAIFE